MVADARLSSAPSCASVASGRWARISATSSVSGSGIAGPDGAWIVEPVPEREVVLVADLDPRRRDEEVMALDVAGHYARPDLLSLTVQPGPPRA